MANTPEDMLIAGIASGTVHMLSSIVRVLEENKLLKPNEFSQALEEAATQLENAPGSPFPPNFPRQDVWMMRRVAAVLKRPQGGWKPIVIEGGLDPSKNQ